MDFVPINSQKLFSLLDEFFPLHGLVANFWSICSKNKIWQVSRQIKPAGKPDEKN
jgi:hypothetical protein